jgi:hypothetical protein
MIIVSLDPSNVVIEHTGNKEINCNLAGEPDRDIDIVGMLLLFLWDTPGLDCDYDAHPECPCC